MNKQQRASKNRKSVSQHTDRKAIILGSFVALILAASPYLFYLYESVPVTPVWDTFLFTYTSKGYSDAQTTMWIFTGKAIPLFFLLIWFFTCRHWWHHTILVPITMYTYQIVGLFNDDTKYIDQFQLIYLIPIMAVMIPSIYLVRAKMFNKINDANKSMQDLEDEFKIQPKSFLSKLKDYF